MTTLTKTLAGPQGLIRTDILGIAAVFAIGAVIVTLAGHVQAATLHDAAHDTRHATGFPCH